MKIYLILILIFLQINVIVCDDAEIAPDDRVVMASDVKMVAPGQQGMASGGSGGGDSCVSPKAGEPTKEAVESGKTKATNIAQKAALEAKAAQEAQAAAGQQAAHQVKEQLAEKALEAAEAAEAALSGKQAIVEQLQEQVREAEAVEREEANAIQQEGSIAGAALQAAQEANAEVKLLGNALQVAQALAANAEQSAQGAQAQAQQKEQLIDAAKNREAALQKQLEAARADLANTKKSAAKAACAAHEAKEGAMRNKRKSMRTMTGDRTRKK